MANSDRLRGLVGQRLAVRSRSVRTLGITSQTSGSGTIISPAFPTICEAWQIGGGGGGATGGGSGGGGGGATYKRFRCPPSSTLQYSVGGGGVGGGSATDGGATTLTLPSGFKVSASGGLSGVSGSGLGGSGVGGDDNRTGTTQAAGLGGTSAGFVGILPGAAGGNNGGAPNGLAPGGGGGPASGSGAPGAILLIFIRLIG